MPKALEEGSYVELLGKGPRVFAHDIATIPGMAKVVEKVPGLNRYDRVIPIARENDVVFLREKPETEYIEWLKSVGLGTRKLIVLDGKFTQTLPERIITNGAKSMLFKMLGERKAVFAPFYGGQLEEKASQYLDMPMYANPELVQKLYSKIYFKQICREIGVPVVKDTVFSVSERIKSFKEKINESSDETGRVIVKGEFGSSASLTYLFNGADEKKMKEIMSNNNKKERYLIEPFYGICSSPSTVWFITRKGKSVHLKSSEQILDKEKICHEGNEFPVKKNEEKINEFSFKLAKAFAEKGFIGPFGIDFINTDGKTFATECNPRVTGSIYPWELTYLLEKRHGKINAAKARNVYLGKPTTFKRLKKLWKDLLYDGKQANNKLLPFNVGPMVEGKISVVGMDSSPSEVEGLFQEAEKKLKDL